MLNLRVSTGPAIVLVFAAAVLLGVAGCRNGATPENSPPNEERSQDSVSPEPVRTTVTIGYGRPPLLHARSLRALVDEYETIVVAKVTTATDVTFAHLPAAEDHPRLEATVRATINRATVAPTGTYYSATVIRSLGRSAKFGPGQTIIIGQAGGVKNGVAYQLDEDPLISVGTTYLFIVREDGDRFVGSAFGRFQIDAAGRFMPNGWESYAGVAAISGRTIDEAAARVARAFTEPDVPLAAATATGTSTLTVTPTIAFSTATPTPTQPLSTATRSPATPVP